MFTLINVLSTHSQHTLDAHSMLIGVVLIKYTFISVASMDIGFDSVPEIMFNRFNAILRFKILRIKCWCQLVFVQYDFTFAKVACQSLVDTGVLILYYMLETISRACSI